MFQEEVFSDETAVKENEIAETVEQKNDDEFDLSDITAEPKEMSREDIIAAAEAAAFSEE